MRQTQTDDEIPPLQGKAKRKRNLDRVGLKSFTGFIMTRRRHNILFS